MSAFLPPLLSESDQAAAVAAAYENRLCAAAGELGLHPASVQRTRAEVPAFAAALEAADDWQAMRIAESLRQLAVEAGPEAGPGAGIGIKARVPLAKELLRQRPPSAWTQAKRAGRAGRGQAAGPRPPLTTGPAQPLLPPCQATPAPPATSAPADDSASRSRRSRWTDPPPGRAVGESTPAATRASSPSGSPGRPGAAPGAAPDAAPGDWDAAVDELRADPLLGPLLHPPPELTAAFAGELAAPTDRVD